MKHSQMLNIMQTDILLMIVTLLRRSSPLSGMLFTSTCRLLRDLGKEIPIRVLKLSMFRGDILLAHAEHTRNNRFKTSEITYCAQANTSINTHHFWLDITGTPLQRQTTNLTDRPWYQYEGGRFVTKKICQLLFNPGRLCLPPRFSLNENNSFFHYHPSSNPEAVGLGCAKRLRDCLHAGDGNKAIEVAGIMAFKNDTVLVSFTLDCVYERRLPEGHSFNNGHNDFIVMRNATIVSIVLKKPPPPTATTT